MFADVLQGDFRLASASPLIDAGLDTPHGGLSVSDVAGAVRLLGAHVDAGAYESPPAFIFQDGFE